MGSDIDIAVDLLAELAKERLASLRNELRVKIEVAIQIAAGNLPGSKATANTRDPYQQERKNQEVDYEK